MLEVVLVTSLEDSISNMYTYGSNAIQTSQQLNSPAPTTESASSAPQSSPTPTYSDNSGASDFLSTGAGALASGAGKLFSGIANSGFGKAVGSVFSGIDNLVSPQKWADPQAPDTFSLAQDLFSVPQRALFTLVSTPFSSKQNPAPNYFDFSQTPGTQASKYALGGGSNFLTELAASLADPLMLLGGGEGDLAKVALSDGSKAALSSEGVGALKDLAQQVHGTTDLTSLEQAGKLEPLKQQVAGWAETTHPQFLDQGGLKVAGKTVIPQSTFDSFKQAVSDSKVGQFFQNNPISQALQELTNPAFTRAGVLTPEELQAVKDINGSKAVALQKMQDLIASVFKGLNPDELSQFRDAAKFGLPVGDSRIDRPDLIGKTIEQLKKLAPNVSDNVLNAYHTYINDALPKLEQIGKEHFNLGEDHAATNYLHEYKPDRMNLRQIFGSRSQPVKYMNKSGSTRQALESSQIIDEAIQKGVDPEQALKDAGFETNPALTTGHLAQERFLGQELNGHIDNVIKQFGTKVNPKALLEDPAAQGWLAKNRITNPTLKDAIRYYKEQGHGIFQPQGNLRFYKSVEGNEIKVSNKVPTYAVSAPLASKLNELRAGAAFKNNMFENLSRKATGAMLKFQFAFPQFAALHGVWHLAFNAFLESGGKYGLGAIGDTFNDIKNESPFYKMLQEKGALPHHLNTHGATVDELINKAAGGNDIREGFLRSLWNNPVTSLVNGKTVNKGLMTEDDFLRTLTIRNNIQSKGMSLQEAINRSNKFLVDYNNLTSQEQSFIKLLMPFYAWTKGNLGAQTAAWMEHPWRQLVPHKVQEVLNQEFSGHNMESNQSGKQDQIDTGVGPSGNEQFTKIPTGSQDLSSIIDNPFSFATNRAGQVVHMASIAGTGTDFGYPVSNPNSPTPEGIQRVAGIFNKAVPPDLTQIAGNFPNAEAKLGIILDPAQYSASSETPKTLREKILGATGISTTSPSSPDAAAGFKSYEQRKIIRSLEKKGVL